MTRLLVLLPLLAACAPNEPSKPPRAEHVYEIDYLLTAEGGRSDRAKVVVDDQGQKDVVLFQHLHEIEMRTVFHTEGNVVYLEVAFEGGEKKERLHTQEPLVIDFERDTGHYELVVTPKRLR